MSSSISSMPETPNASVAEQSRQELQAKLNGLGGISGRKLSPEAKAKKLREACEGFESIFIQKMWQEMRNAVPKAGLMQGREEKFWQDMYDQELAKSMTSAGGIGLANMMYEQLSRNLASASRGAAGQVAGAAFTPAAAPLVTGESSFAEDAAMPRAADVKPMPSIYDGEAPQTGGEDQPHEDAPLPQAEVKPARHPSPTPAATAHAAVAPEERQERKHSRSATAAKSHSSGENGINMAYLAQRDAGDKLGSGAIRPALRHRKQPKAVKTNIAETPQAPQNYAALTQTGNIAPGTAEGLKAALELARSGAEAPQNGTATQLHNIVAAVQAQNAAGMAMQAAAAQPVAPMAEAASAPETETAEPITRKVRYTTNIPSKNRAAKKGGDAIRLLNVDNVGVNSKAGKGLAAYHAAQEAAARNNAPSAQPAQNDAEHTPPISPLTAQSAAQKTAQPASFAIPPLRSGDLQGNNGLAG